VNVGPDRQPLAAGTKSPLVIEPPQVDSQRTAPRPQNIFYEGQHKPAKDRGSLH
jgi:hypothetical protein